MPLSFPTRRSSDIAISARIAGLVLTYLDPRIDRLEAEVAVQPARIDHRVRIGILLVEIDVIGGAGDDHREGVAEHALLEVEFVVEIVRVDHPHARKALGYRTEKGAEIEEDR